MVLSVHTRGGQITFLGIVPFKPRGSGTNLKGWYKESEPKMYISKGIGTSILPIRFGARAEMVVIEIYKTGYNSKEQTAELLIFFSVNLKAIQKIFLNGLSIFLYF